MTQALNQTLNPALHEAMIPILDRVGSVRRAWRGRLLLQGLVAAAAACVLGLSIATLIDQSTSAPTAGRWALFVGVLVCVAVAVWRWVVRPLAVKRSDDYFAALIEQRQPSLGNRIINALQLGRQESATSPRLVEAIVAQGAIAAEEIEPRRALDGETLKRHAIALAAAFAVMGIYMVLAGPGARVSLMRVVFPWAQIQPFSWTQITLLAPTDSSVTLMEGSPLTIDISTAGRVPSDASVNWSDSSGAKRKARMTPCGTDRFTFTFDSVDSPMTCFATAGDARTNSFAVAVLPRPRIKSMSVVYRLPKYAQMPDRTVDDFDGHLRSLKQTRATLTVRSNTPLDSLTMNRQNVTSPLPFTATADPAVWNIDLILENSDTYSLKLTDKSGHSVDTPAMYTITAEAKSPPLIEFTMPGRDLQLKPGETIPFVMIAQDDYGLGQAVMTGKVVHDKISLRGAPEPSPVVLKTWPDEPTTPGGAPSRRLELKYQATVEELGLKPGETYEYWANVVDRNNLSNSGPGRGESRHYRIFVVNNEMARMLLDRQLADYARVLTEIIRLQQLNRTETAGENPAKPLAERQGLIRRDTLGLADNMESNAFPAATIISELRDIANSPMTQVLTLMESSRDAQNLAASKTPLAQSLPVQDKIIEQLEDILKRINKDQAVRDALKKMEKSDKAEHREVTAVIGKMSGDLEKFLSEQKTLQDTFDKMAKRTTNDDMTAEEKQALNDAAHLMDRYKQWAKDSADAIAKLPEGFVKDAALAQTVSTIFEEIEKKERAKTSEVAAPLEEGMMGLNTKTKEDLEMWLPDQGDSAKNLLEDPMGGKFEVPEEKLPENLQDIVGDLIENLDEFDKDADDVTSSFGGNLDQAGWGIADGQMSTFDAKGKTGNQMPNNHELTGRSGAGRRGCATGQMVGDESKAMEGRPTPARVTDEKYEAGMPKAESQLNPNGSTGGGKKTGGGTRGLQGGTPPDFLKDMKRLESTQNTLREKAQQLAHNLENVGRPSQHVNRAVELMDSAVQDMKDLRYDDAARKRKQAIGELRTEETGIDTAVSLSLDKAHDLPPDVRTEISTSVQKALPEGYEDLVGAYYKALSGAAPTSASNPAPNAAPQDGK